MKRKIFSKLLMGAFLIASVSSFVSCKDYDDDINNLQKQIDAAALKAELTTLQTNLAAQIAAAQSAAQAAQAAAEKAQATANNAATKDALEAVKTLATAAGTDAAKAIADAANAQNTADVAKSAATAAQEAAAAAQNVANGASDKAATALADAAKALATAEAANATATAANTAATAADATAKEAKATATQAIAAAGNATTQAADAVKAAGEAKAAAEAAKYNDEAVKLLIAQAQASADAAAEDAKEAAEAAAAAVLASASATEDAATAKEAAAKAEETIKDAIANATKAIEEATDAKIKAAVAEAVAKIPTDQSEAVAEQAAAIETLKGNLQTLADAQGKLATAEGLSSAVTELEGKIGGVADAAATAAVAAAAGTIKDAMDVIYSAVTSVELVSSFSGSTQEDLVTFPLGFATTTGVAGIDLDFIFGKMQWTAKFGDKETESGWSEGNDHKGQDMEGFDADEIIPYTAGADIRAKRALLVRVNPTNAKFDKSMVKFVNSKLESLDGLVEIYDEPYRYDGIITRGEESGLWVIPVKVVDGTSFNKFNEAVFYNVGGKAWNSTTDYVKNAEGENELNIGKAGLTQKLYAVAIKNTTDPEDAETPRYVTSTFDIATAYRHYAPERYIQAYFEWTNIKKTPASAWITGVHNRWWSDVSDPTHDNGEPANSAGIWSIDQKEAYTLLNPEKKWNPKYGTSYPDYYATGKIFTPTSAEPNVPHPFKNKFSDNDERWNTTNATDDYRRDQPMIDIAEVGQTIKVTLPSGLQKKFEYWYITYDFQLNAVESSPSEWEAWKSYKDEIAGIYEMTPATKPINLTINKLAAFNDVIGFRIWAVNYDGSLADPDGRAFYVKVGDSTNKPSKTASAQFKAVSIANNLGAIANLNAKNYTDKDGFNVSAVTDLADYGFESLALSKNNGKTEVFATKADGTHIGIEGKTSAPVYVYWKLLDSKGNLATNWKDIKKLVVGVDGSDLNKIVDDATLDVTTIQDKRGDANNPEVYTLKIQAQKVLPQNPWVKENYYDNKFTWHSDYDPVSNIMTIYPKPYKTVAGVSPLYPVDLDADAKKVDFYWRGNGGTGAWNLWDAYFDNVYLDWLYGTGITGTTDLANAGIRQIQDYNYKPKDDAASGLDMSLYFFEFDGMPTGIKESASEKYKTYWTAAGGAKPKFGDNTFVAVKPEVIRTDKPAHLFYTFTKVSTKYDSKTKAYDVKDHTVSVWDFTARFKDALDLVENKTDYAYMTYTEYEKNPLGAIQKKGTKYLIDNTLYIAWKNGTTTGTDFSLVSDPTISNKLELYRLATNDCTYPAGINPETGLVWANQDEAYSFNPALYDKDYTNAGAKSDDITTLLFARISASNDVLATGVNMAGTWSGAGLQIADWTPFDPAYYSFDNPATDKVVENAPTFELEGEITTYLKIDQKTCTATALKAFKVGGISDPKRNIKGNLIIKGYDVFGKDHKITIPVEIVFNF